MKPVKLSLEKDEAKESKRGRDRREGGGTEKWRMRGEGERERGGAASERTVKPPFETNRLEDEFEPRWLREGSKGRPGVVTNTEMVKVY